MNSMQNPFIWLRDQWLKSQPPDDEYIESIRKYLARVHRWRVLLIAFAVSYSAVAVALVCWMFPRFVQVAAMGGPLSPQMGLSFAVGVSVGATIGFAACTSFFPVAMAFNPLHAERLLIKYYDAFTSVQPNGEGQHLEESA